LTRQIELTLGGANENLRRLGRILAVELAWIASHPSQHRGGLARLGADPPFRLICGQLRVV